MKNELETYLEEIYGILGDPFHKRYSGTDLSEGLRLALDDYDDCFPKQVVLTVEVKETAKNGRLLSVGFLPDWVISVRKARPKGHSDWALVWESRKNSGETLLKVYGNLPKVEAGGEIELSVNRKHSISGIEWENTADTTVPRKHKSLLCCGAAGYAMMIRSRSVTEVFGKRPEDGKILYTKGLSMVKAYRARLEEKSLIEFDD